MHTRMVRARVLFIALTQAKKQPTDRTTRRFRRAAAVLSLAFASVILAAPAQERGGAITLDDALRQFRERGFDLLLANAAIAGAEGDVTAAGAIANPSLSLSRGSTSTYDPALCSGCSTTSISASVTDQAALSDALSGKRRFRVAIARAALQASRLGRADAERTLGFTVKGQLLQAELGREALGYAHEAQRLASETLDLVTKRYAAGAVSEADLARAEVQKLEADQAADVAEQSFVQAKAVLAYLLGYDDAPPGFDVAGDLVDNAVAPPLATASRDEMLHDALAHRPDLAAVRFQIERARAGVGLAQRLAIPDFFPSIQYSQEGRGQNAIQPPTVTLGISASLPLFNRYRGEVAKARADLQTQEVSQKKVEAQIASDVSSAYTAFTRASSRLLRMKGRLLDRAARARDLVRLQYEKGAASLFELLDAQRTFLGTQNEYLQTLNDYWIAVFQLEQATGVELRP
jgi:outer membrane protein, heavy metal efflux system